MVMCMCVMAQTTIYAITATPPLIATAACQGVTLAPHNTWYYPH